MIPDGKSYLIRCMYYDSVPDAHFIDFLGFKLTASDLSNIKSHNKRFINGIEFHYIAPDVVIYLGSRKYVVATLDTNYNEWYLYKWDDRRNNVNLIKVI